MAEGEAKGDARQCASNGDTHVSTVPPDENTSSWSATSHASQHRAEAPQSPSDVLVISVENYGSNGNENGKEVKNLSPDVSEIPEARSKSPWRTLSVLLLGVFVAQIDQSLVLATYGRIASDFQQLYLGSWIISSFILTQCAVQPLYGKLSDIYSRKSCLLTAYVLFAVGTLGAGLSRSMAEIIAWRAIQGAGGSGMVSVVSIIITDIVPRRDIATMRSYVNVLQTTGRSCGGVIGGLLTQAVGWRWAFLVQVPPTVVAIVLVACALRLPSPPAAPERTGGTDATVGDEKQTRWVKLRRVDFIGAFFLLATILSVCLLLDLGGQRLPWNSPVILAILGAGVAAGVAFVVSARYAREPIFPLRLLTHWTVVSNYAVVVLSVMAQTSLMAVVPIYFQATAHASTAAAGVHLIPAFVGNTLGGLSAGYWIKRTGRYKPATVVAPLISVFCMVLLFLTWRGNTSPAQSIFIFPGGFAMGMVYASAFVGLVTGTAEQDVAVSASGMYLFFNIGAIAAISASSAVSERAIRDDLQKSLEGFPQKQEIITNALNDLAYIWTVDSEDIRQILISAYTRGFNAVNVFGMACSSAAFLFAISSKGTQIDETET